MKVALNKISFEKKVLKEPSVFRNAIFEIERHRAYGNKLRWTQALLLRLFTTGKFPATDTARNKEPAKPHPHSCLKTDDPFKPPDKQ